MTLLVETDHIMARQDANEAFLQTAFLYGANAGYIEDLYARYQQDPSSVDAQWQAFFGALEGRQAGGREERPRRVLEEAELARSRQRRTRLALDGNWSQVEKAVGEKIQAKAQTKGSASRRPMCSRRPAIPFARSCSSAPIRVRGHLHAKLDPLGIQQRADNEELHPSHYGFTDADWDRKIFLDGVLGMEFRHHPRDGGGLWSAPIARRSASSSCTSRIRSRRPGFRSASRAPTRRSPSPARASAPSSTSSSEAEGFERFLDCALHGTKRFGPRRQRDALPGARSRSSSAAETSACKEIVLGMAHRGPPQRAHRR
jgi:2-oxoglutarate dehydrogenase E1 component